MALRLASVWQWRWALCQTLMGSACPITERALCHKETSEKNPSRRRRYVPAWLAFCANQSLCQYQECGSDKQKARPPAWFRCAGCHSPFSSLEPGSLKWILFILHWPGENCTWLFMNWVSQQDSARQPEWGWSACVKLPGQNWSQAVTHNAIYVWSRSLRTSSLQGQKHAKWGREDFCSFSLSYWGWLFVCWGKLKNKQINSLPGCCLDFFYSPCFHS